MMAIWSEFSRQTPAVLELDLVQGQTYYVAVHGQSKVGSWGGGIGVVPIPTSFRMGSALVEMPAVAAEEALLRCCKLHKPLSPEF
jgi:hypothetical protein